jgi:ferritin-like metal-binding protein YciE
MTPNALDEQLNKYLTDVHSIELQALAQLQHAPQIASDEEIAAAFSSHLTETEGQERLVAERLSARGAAPTRTKDAAGKLTGIGFALFAEIQPDTPGKLVAHAYSYEHLELAAYDLLAQVAERADDAETVQAAREIEQQERAMAERLAASFDRAVGASLDAVQPESLDEQLNKYLADAHAIESQAIQLLEKAPQLAGAGQLAMAYQDHLGQTEEHQRLIARRLEARGDSPSRLKDAAMRLGALNWGAFFAAQPDTAAKLAGFSYAFEHLEIAAYEQLGRVAQRAGDSDTESTAERILEEERAAAEHIRSLFPTALDASLQEQGVGVP